jgi:hypothetical protein
MMRIAGVVVFGLLVAGCATDASVKKQIEPLDQRVTALEKQQAATNAKLDAQAAELQALRKNVSDTSAASAARAEQAAKEAAAAAERAEAAAQKSTKAFELGQVKGGKKK